MLVMLPIVAFRISPRGNRNLECRVYAAISGLTDQSCRSTSISLNCFTCLVIPEPPCWEPIGTVTVEYSRNFCYDSGDFEYLMANGRLFPAGALQIPSSDNRFGSHLLVTQGQIIHRILRHLYRIVSARFNGTDIMSVFSHLARPVGLSECSSLVIVSPRVRILPFYGEVGCCRGREKILGRYAPMRLCSSGEMKCRSFSPRPQGVSLRTRRRWRW